MRSHNDPIPATYGESQSVLSYTPKLSANYVEQIPKIEKLLLYLEGKGRSKNTIEAYKKNLKALAIRANLQETQAVEQAIARYTKKNKRPATNNYKSKLCDHYDRYCKFYQIFWEKPIYTPEPVSIQPPTDEKAKMLIAAAKGTLSLKIDIIAQTGLRPIEIQGEKGLQAKDIHPDQKTLTSRSVKGCNARPPLPISEELLCRLQAHVKRNSLKPDELLFTGDARRFGEHFRRLRNRLAAKLNDDSIRSIRLYDLRHAYVTRQLRRTQNTETVRIIVGHKHLNTTQKYLHLILNPNGEWIVEGTTDKNRVKELLINDFTYQLTTPDGTMLFKKAK